MEDVRIKEWLSSDGSGYGYGSGSGYGYGDGSGDGSGYGSGYGYGSGSGYGYGDGYGSGSGSGSGYGSGDGSGEGSGYGSGYGYGSGSGYGYGGLLKIDENTVFVVDSVPTIITHIHNNVAKGFILQSDLTMKPCFLVKGNGCFAHGETLREAMTALVDKMFYDMPEEDRIDEFIKAHPDKDKKYPNNDLFNWHHRLTGSCLAGRNAFVKDRGLTLDGETTVEEFIKLTENAYNGDVIKHLKNAYKKI